MIFFFITFRDAPRRHYAFAFAGFLLFSVDALFFHRHAAKILICRC